MQQAQRLMCAVMEGQTATCKNTNSSAVTYTRGDSSGVLSVVLSQQAGMHSLVTSRSSLEGSTCSA